MRSSGAPRATMPARRRRQPSMAASSAARRGPARAAMASRAAPGRSLTARKARTASACRRQRPALAASARSTRRWAISAGRRPPTGSMPARDHSSCSTAEASPSGRPASSAAIRLCSSPIACPRAAAVQLGLQLARPGEGALQAGGQRRGQVQAVDEGREQPDVAQHQGQVRAPAGGGRGPGQGGDLGVGGHGVAGLEGLDADLQELLGPVAAARGDAEGLAFIEIAARDRAGLQVLASDGDGEVGPQAGLLAAVAGHHEQPRAHRLAGQVQQQAQGLHHRRVGQHGAGRGQRRADGVERGGRNGAFQSHWSPPMILRTAATSSRAGWSAGPDARPSRRRCRRRRRPARGPGPGP
jgi:hypothetical protein